MLCRDGGVLRGDSGVLCGDGGVPCKDGGVPRGMVCYAGMVVC